MFRKLFRFPFILFLAGCSLPFSAPATTPTVERSPTPSATPSLKPSPRPTETSTPTLTPTETATPTPTFTPSPTPTPIGYYKNDSAAFSLIYGPGWRLDEDDAYGAVFSNENDFSMMYVFSQVFLDAEEGGMDPESFASAVAETTFESDYELVERDQIVLADGISTERIIVSFDYEIEFLAHVITPYKNNRQYMIVLFGPRNILESRRVSITKMFESFSMLSGQIYGLERDGALVLMGFDPDPENIDPATTLNGAGGYSGLLFSGLVRLSPDLQIVPDLAENWTISPDGTVYTFVLREDAAFTDGRPITAADVKYSWERAADPETESTTVLTYMGDIVGLKEKFEGSADEIVGVRVIDERTLEVTLDGPKPYFLAKLTYPSSFIVDQQDIERDPKNWMFNPNASGPYKMREFREEDAIIFERNENYYDPAQIPYVVFLLYRSGSFVSYYEAGEIDIAHVGSEDLEAIESPDNPLSQELHVQARMCTTYIQMNNTLPPFDDPRVRQAFALSVDKDRLNELFRDNRSLIANSVLPPAMPGYNAELPAQKFDPQMARELLDSSSYAGNLPPIRIGSVGYGDSDDPFLTALIDMWQQALGVEILVEYVDPDNFSKKLREMEMHISVSGWCADYPDPENFLDVLFHSESQFNFANYQHPEIDALLEEARTEPDPFRRITLYQQIEAMLLEDYAVIPLFHDISYTLVKPYLQGWVDSAMQVPFYHLLSIERGGTD